LQNNTAVVISDKAPPKPAVAGSSAP
jgi:hypothetical protein